MSHTESRRAVKRREALNTFYYYRGDCELVILVSSLRRWSFCNHTLVFVWSLYFWSDCDLRCVFVVWATWKAPDYQPFVCFCQWGFLESCLVTFHKNTEVTSGVVPKHQPPLLTKLRLSIGNVNRHLVETSPQNGDWSHVSTHVLLLLLLDSCKTFITSCIMSVRDS